MIHKKIAAVLIPAALFLGVAAPALANDKREGASADMSLKAEQRGILKASVGAKIDARLNKITRGSSLEARKAHIVATARRANGIADMMTAMSAKLQVRIDAKKAEGADVSAMVAAQADLAVKVASAKAHTALAVTAVSALTADSDKTNTEATVASFKQARLELRAAEADLKAARHDIKIVISILAGKRI